MLELPDENFDYPDNPESIKFHLVSWLAGVGLGIFIGICLVLLYYAIEDPQCIAGPNCSVHRSLPKKFPK